MSRVHAQPFIIEWSLPNIDMDDDGEEDIPGHEEKEEDLDYYDSAPVMRLEPKVKEFVEKAYSRCIPRAKRRRLTREYPRPDTPATKVPKLDMVFQSALGRTSTDRSDDQLSRIQTSVLAAGAPIANFWSHLEAQGLIGQPGETIPTLDVVRVMKDTLALLGNAVSYISRTRRSQFISSINSQRPTVAKFLREVTKESNTSTGSELFGPEVQKLVTSRADTIDAFNKAVSKVEATTKRSGVGRENRFLSGRPTAYGSRSGREYVPYKQGNTRGRYQRQSGRGKQGKFPPKPHTTPRGSQQ